MLGNDKGQAIVEMAIIMPIFIALIGLAIDGSWLIYQQHRLQSMATKASVYASAYPEEQVVEKVEEFLHLAGCEEDSHVDQNGSEYIVMIQGQADLFFAPIFGTKYINLQGFSYNKIPEHHAMP